MLVFIDDSGDPGFKFNKGSTRHFVIVMVIFDDELEAEKTAVAIKELKRKIGFSENSEFRFFKTRKDFRLRFFEALNKYNWRVRCLVVDKTLISSRELKSDKNSFYSFFIKEALKYSGSSIRQAKIKIDGSGDRIFRKNFFTYLRRELGGQNLPMIRHCKMADSKNNVLIQMADMVAGSINRFCNKEKNDRQEYISKFKDHLEDIWYFR